MKNLIEALSIFESYGFNEDDVTLIGDKLCVNRENTGIDMMDQRALADCGFEYDNWNQRWFYDFGRL